MRRIAVIRNPINRFISASTYLFTFYGKEIQQKMEDYDEFVSIIGNFYKNFDVEIMSWWRPQIEFLNDDTHIWKFEKGLDDDFGDWFSEKVGVDFKIDPTVNYAQNDYEDFKLDKTDKLIQNIKKFCSEDIEQLYPELL